MKTSTSIMGGALVMATVNEALPLLAFGSGSPIPLGLCLIIGGCFGWLFACADNHASGR